MAEGELMPAESESKALAPATQQAQSLVEAIERAARDDTVDVSKMERLFDLHQRLRDEQAEAAFNQAFVALQMELPEIEETKGIPDAKGNIKYKYTPYADIMLVLRPLLRKHGFATSRSQSSTGELVTEHLTVMHTGGHSRTTTFSVRRGSGPPKSGSEQADGSAASFAARYALRDAFDLVFIAEGHPEDARAVGSPISFEQAVEIRERVQSAEGYDEHKFLKYAGVDVPSSDEITTGHYEQIMDGALHRIFGFLESKGV